MKLCIFCKWFRLDMGESGWSDVTPGYDAVIECGNYSNPLRWAMTKNDGNDYQFKVYLLRANICQYFEYSADVLIHIKKTNNIRNKKSFCGLSEDYQPMFTRSQINDFKDKSIKLNLCPKCLEMENLNVK